MKKKILIGISILLLVLILTNPTLQDFKENIGFKESKDNSVSKKYNFLLFSIYEYNSTIFRVKEGATIHDKGFDNKDHTYSTSSINLYLGVLKNFISVDHTSMREIEIK